jgi:hypothetical protein
MAIQERHEDRRLDSDAAARFLGVKRGTVELWRQRGFGPAYHHVGRCVRYSLADLRAFLASTRVVPSAAISTEARPIA